MSTVTQRMLKQTIAVAMGADAVVWGQGEDAVLNGGTRLVAWLRYNDPAVLSVSLWIQATPDAPFTLQSTEALASGSSVYSVPVAGYAARLTADWNVAPGDPDVEVSAQVQS